MPERADGYGLRLSPATLGRRRKRPQWNLIEAAVGATVRRVTEPLPDVILEVFVLTREGVFDRVVERAAGHDSIRDRDAAVRTKMIRRRFDAIRRSPKNPGIVCRSLVTSNRPSRAAMASTSRS
jgi:hypothetical protein